MGHSGYSDGNINEPQWKKSNRNLPKNRTIPAKINFNEFCEFYDLTKSVNPEIFGSISEYVIGNKLVQRNWTELCEAYNYLIVYFEGDHWLLHKLIYSICHERLDLNKKYKLPGGIIRAKDKSQLHHEENEKENERREKYLYSLENVIEYLTARANHLDPLYAEDANPLSAIRVKSLFDQLNQLLLAEKRINELDEIKNGNRSRFVYDSDANDYGIVGKAVIDPTTVFLIYVWKCKVKHNGESLTDLDYQKVAVIYEFWKFFSKELEHLQNDQVKYLKERLRYYRSKNILFYPSGWINENIPMVYLE